MTLRNARLDTHADAPMSVPLITNDRCETQVFYSEATTRFLIVDYCAKPTTQSWVMVGRYATGEILIQRYRGQAYQGVAYELELYKMPGSARWNLETIHVCSD